MRTFNSRCELFHTAGVLEDRRTKRFEEKLKENPELQEEIGKKLKEWKMRQNDAKVRLT